MMVSEFNFAPGILTPPAGAVSTIAGTDEYEVVVKVITSGTGTLNKNPANTYFRGFQH